jgi:hypothetical protein
MKALFASIAIAAIPVCVWIAFHSTQQLHQIAARQKILAEQQIKLRDEAATLEAAARAQQEKTRALQTSLDSVKKAAAAQAAIASTTPAKAPGTLNAPINPLGAIATNADILPQYVEAYRQSLYVRYGGLFKQLGFNHEQMVKFLDMEVQNQQNTLDLEAAAATQGLTPRDPAYLAMQQQTNSENRQNETALLGNGAAIENLDEYRRTQPVRNLAIQLTASSTYLNAPVSTSQIDALTQVLAANSQRGASHFSIPNTVNWDAVIAQSQSFLQPAQLAALQQLRQRSELGAQYDKMISQPGPP